MVLNRKGKIAYEITSCANNCVHKTEPARRNFHIIARPKRLVGFVSFVLPVRARIRLVTHSVSYACNGDISVQKERMKISVDRTEQDGHYGNVVVT